MPTRAAQSFLLDHARARQAVWSSVDWASVEAGLNELGLGIIEVASKAGDRATYVRRPAISAELSPPRLQSGSASMTPGCDVAIILADGLSASAIDINAVPLTQGDRRTAVGPAAFHCAYRSGIAGARRHRRSHCGDHRREGVGHDHRRTSRPFGGRQSRDAYLTHSPAIGTPDSKQKLHLQRPGWRPCHCGCHRPGRIVGGRHVESRCQRRQAEGGFSTSCRVRMRTGGDLPERSVTSALQ